MAAGGGGDLGVEDRGGDLADLLEEDGEILGGGVKDLEDAGVEEQGPQRPHVEVGGEDVDHRGVLAIGDLH
jgi:hypothetical protein